MLLLIAVFDMQEGGSSDFHCENLIGLAGNPLIREISMVCVISYIACTFGSTNTNPAMPLYVLLMCREIKIHSRLGLYLSFTHSSGL